MHRSVRTILILPFMLLSVPSSADTVRDYMIRSIDAGEVSGIVDDATARAWQQQTGSSSPVMVRVIPVGTFKEKGCKRLQVLLSQEGVRTQEGKVIRLGLPMELNLCRDGRPPMEGVDPARLREAMAKNRQK